MSARRPTVFEAKVLAIFLKATIQGRPGGWISIQTLVHAANSHAEGVELVVAARRLPQGILEWDSGFTRARLTTPALASLRSSCARRGVRWPG